MGLVTRLILSAFIGFASHIFWQPTQKIDERDGRRWGEKMRQAIGILTIALPQAMIYENLDMPAKKSRSIVATLLAGLSYGGGNLLAHFFDSE